MTPVEYRRLALSFPEATEGEHMNHPDFRVSKRIFATLWPTQNRGVVKLTPDQQKTLTKSAPAIFSPVPGGWGRRGSTNVSLELADEASVRNALTIAWSNIAPKRLQHRK
jgi:hypothetical protein